MKYKHLTLQDRQRIELLLNEKKTFSEIAHILEKDKCTISKEVRSHVKYFKVGGQGVNYNSCKHRYNCRKAWLCGTCTSPKKYKTCRRCARATSIVPILRKKSVPGT